MAGLKTYRDLDAWSVGMTVVELTYAVAKSLPADERYELSAQMRRAAISIPSNVAEGFGRGTPSGCAHFVTIAIGSTAELDTQLEAARRLKLVTCGAGQPLQEALDRERQILYGLRRNRQRQAARSAGAILLWMALASAYVLG